MEFNSNKILKEIVNKQLRAKATNFHKVAYFCIFNFPVVIESLPVKNGKPFPTIHYLTCPFLIKEISRLEEKGYIKYFEEKIQKDENFRKKVFKAHEEVIKKRNKMFNEISEIKNFQIWKEQLNKVGTGGIRDWTKVKCLHLHFADYLAGIDNPIGREIFNMIKNLNCDDEYCSRFKKEIENEN
ncbi:MAG: uncharacterized protein PWP54_44 [Thermosipho sp. (in: thermotogales)]|nr:uncharacterized protein [Thermosipho sp. (in: thermotogales)]